MTVTAAATASSKQLSKSGMAFFGSLCLSTFGLGCWQTQRYFEKIEQMAIREEELAMSPITDMTNPDNTGHRRITFRGTFRHEDEVLVGPRGPPPGAISATGPNSGRSSGGMSSSPQGYYVLAPFCIHGSDNHVILVNRGWVPRSFVVPKNRNETSTSLSSMWERPRGDVVLTGVASLAEQPRFMSPPHDPKQPKQLLWMDRHEIEKRTQTLGLSPLLLTELNLDNDDDDDKNKESKPILFPVKPDKHTVGEFKVTPFTHAGYALTWFGLSGAGMIMTKKLITRGRG